MRKLYSSRLNLNVMLLDGLLVQLCHMPPCSAGSDSKLPRTVTIRYLGGGGTKHAVKGEAVALAAARPVSRWHHELQCPACSDRFGALLCSGSSSNVSIAFRATRAAALQRHWIVKYCSVAGFIF